ncbi:MAG TPA: uroporphyrinogen-III C-methyltransferase [Gammaproteobacteria bacterium]
MSDPPTTDDAPSPVTAPATPEEPAPPPAGGRPRLPPVAIFTLAVALVAVMIAGFLWWQYRQFYVALASADDETAAALERVRAELRAFDDRLQDLEGGIATERAARGDLEQRLAALPTRFADLERRIAAAQGASFEARASWLRAEAEYYLTVANTELALAGRWENAIRALALADERLAELADPELNAVRAAIADELLSLRAVRLPDIDGLVFSLGRLAARVDELPLEADSPAAYDLAPEAPAEAEPGLGRLWASVKQALLGLVRVERRDQPVGPELTAAERLLTRRELALELALARLAALDGRAEAFESALRRALDLLEGRFDTTAAEVEGAMELLQGMLRIDIDPERPAIGRSLTLLRGAAAAEGD